MAGTPPRRRRSSTKSAGRNRSLYRTERGVGFRRLFLFGCGQDGTGVHNPKRIERRLDRPHRGQLGWIAISRQIVDLVSTGTTLKMNGLVETQPIIDITARLIVNRAALKTDPRVGELVAAFRADAEARSQEAA